MGVVYKAEDTKLKRNVALKFLPQDLTRDPEANARFILEAQAASALDHQNICTIHEINETKKGQTYIVMAFYEGQTLKQLIQDRPLKIDESIRIITQIAEGLSNAHRKGIIHRDIKPANVIFDEDNTAKILDFGLAKLSGQTVLTQTGTRMGTIKYMSPEQTSGEQVDQRSDIWALGILLYEMLTGQHPFKGSYDQAIIYSIMNEEPQPVSLILKETPFKLEKIVAKSLRKNPDDRYQSIDDMLYELESLIINTGIREKESLLKSIVRAFQKKEFRYSVISAGLVIILICAFLFVKPIILNDATYSRPLPIMVINFDNQTGDDEFELWEKMLPEMLITKLEQSGGFHVIPWERILNLKKQLGKHDVKFINRELGYQLAIKDSVKMMVTGSLTRAGAMFAIDAKVMNVETRDILKSFSVKGLGEESLLISQIDDLGEAIARGVHDTESLAKSLQEPIRKYTTSSTEAYKLYIEARYMRPSIAIPLLKKAIKIDSTFTRAYLELSLKYKERRQFSEYAVTINKAMKHSDKAPQRERLSIQTWYYFYFKGDNAKADSIGQIYANTYPKYIEPHLLMALIHSSQKKYDQAIVEYNTMLSMNPENLIALNNLGYLYQGMENYDEALNCFRRYAAIKTDPNMYDSMADIYYDMGYLENALTNFKEGFKLCPRCYWSALKAARCYAHKEEYSNAIEWAEKFDFIKRPDLVPYQKAFYYYLAGQYNLARENIDKSLYYGDSLYQAGESPNVVIYFQYILLAWLYYDLDEFDKGLKALQEASNNLEEDRYDYELANTLVSAYFNLYSGLVYTQRGNLDSARIQHHDLYSIALESSFYYQEHVVLFSDLLKAEILTAENSYDEALTILRKIKIPKVDDNFFRFTLPLKDDLIAKTLIKMNNTDEAIDEYERMISSDLKKRGWRFIDPRYRYRLAKLYDQKGWPGKAIEQYKRFLKLWKDADPDHPEMINAKRRLSALEKLE
jgi:serine/threonine protein kinase/tetratricopeptide (TPR) repeat protein